MKSKDIKKLSKEEMNEKVKELKIEFIKAGKKPKKQIKRTLAKLLQSYSK